MRTQLTELEGQTVSVTGRLKEWRKNRSEEFDDICIVTANVTPWDGLSAVDVEASGAKVNHLWVRIPKDMAEAELLTKIHMIGKVTWYRRADGSVDLGVKALKAISMDKLAGDINAYLTKGFWSVEGFTYGDQLLEDIDFCLSCAYHQGQGGYAFSVVYGAVEAVKRLLRYRTQIQRNLEANRKPGLNRLNREKPRGLDLKKPRCMARRQAASGFAA